MKEDLFPILAIDPGLKHFGLAWATTPTAVEDLTPLEVKQWSEAVPPIKTIISKLAIKTVVIGHPEKGVVVKVAQGLKDQLNNSVKVYLYPETLSSQIAWRKLSQAGLKFKQKKDKEHSYAALEILTTFLTTQDSS